MPTNGRGPKRLWGLNRWIAMKTELSSPSHIRCWSSLAMAGFILFAASSRAPAQNDSVTISSAEFRRMVYSAHLLTQLEEKPELEASLEVLLELQCRNPNADPIALAGMLQQATACYRTNAPHYLRRGGGYRDEILATYLDVLRQVPARTNFNSANLALLNRFMLQPSDYATDSAAKLIHAGNRRLLASEGQATKRQALIDACAGRAVGNIVFATALEALMLPEIQVSLANSPGEIIGKTNSPLHDDPTMQRLLELSLASGNGSVTVSSNELISLFTNETRILRGTIETNLALRAAINQMQPDLLAYLTNQAAIDANVQREAAIKQRQAGVIASATAAILVQSRLMEARDPHGLSKEMGAVASTMSSIARGLNIMSSATAGSFTKIMAAGDVLSAGIQVFNLLAGVESPEETIVREIANIKTLINDLSANMNYRFDRVDQSLTEIFNTMNTRFDQIEIDVDEQGRLIAHLYADVDDIRRDLLAVQTDLHRLERHVLTYVNQLYDRGLNESFNTYLGFEATHPGDVLSWDAFKLTPEPKFFTHARDNCQDALSSPYTDRDYSPLGLYRELTESSGGVSNRLDQNLSYIKAYLDNKLSQTTSGSLPLPNPREWFVGSYAYAQLAAENPGYFRRVTNSRLELIIARGNEITDFLRSLTFVGTNLNSSLYDALGALYFQKLTNFTFQLAGPEHEYATNHGFKLDTWRAWSATAPSLVTATMTEVSVTPAMMLPAVSPPQLSPGVLSANWTHFLALRPDGTVRDYGVEADYARPPVPSNATNVAAIAAGVGHNLIMRSNGTLFAWGDNFFGQTNPPTMASNVVAIAAGDSHSLVLRSDRTVVGWGKNNDGQATGIPNSIWPGASTGIVTLAGQILSNVVAIAAGQDHSLALLADGTVRGWGYNPSGQADGGIAGSNVMAVAAGYYHSVALRSNGTVVAWGDNTFGETNVPVGATNVVAIAAGEAHSLALRADGTVVGWGGWQDFGQTTTPAQATNVVAIAAGGAYSLALRADGAVIGWGEGFEGHTPVPTDTNMRAIAAGDRHSLALRADGAVLGWGDNDYGQANGSAAGTNVVAIAAGGTHSVALRAGGSVVSWGDNSYGQAATPGSATNVVAIAAGYFHSLALRADCTVVGWGYNNAGQANGNIAGNNVVAIAVGAFHSLALRSDRTVFAWGSQTTVPAAATNVIAIAAGYNHNLALRADGTVISWGDNGYGQANTPAAATNVVAIAAGPGHSLALRADGTVVGWGDNYHGQIIVPSDAVNIVGIAAGADHSLFLTRTGGPEPGGDGDSFVVRGQIPYHVGELFHGVNGYVITNLQLILQDASLQLSGAKALWTAVLELALPYTLEQDDILRGFLYGSESLIDFDAARIFLEAQNASLEAWSDTKPETLSEVAPLRYVRFYERVMSRLNDLKARGEPELPRLVGHTLRLLNVLREAHMPVPLPALEIGRVTNTLGVVLFGEPYVHYTLQYRESLSVPGWSNTGITNMHNEEIVTSPTSAPRRFYRALLPAP